MIEGCVKMGLLCFVLQLNITMMASCGERTSTLFFPYDYKCFEGVASH
jgi:hypothetical protein